MKGEISLFLLPFKPSRRLYSCFLYGASSSSFWTDDFEQAIALDKQGNYDLALRLFDKVGPLPPLLHPSFSSFADVLSLPLLS